MEAGWLLPDFPLPEPGVRVPHSFSILNNCYWASMMTALRIQQWANETRSLPSHSFHCSGLTGYRLDGATTRYVLPIWWLLRTGLLLFFLEIVKLHFPILKLHCLETVLRLLLLLLLSILKRNFPLPWDVNRSYETVHKIKSTLKLLKQR